MKRFKRRLSQTLRGSHTIDESLSELAEQMTVEENGLKDSGTCARQITHSAVSQTRQAQQQQRHGKAPAGSEPSRARAPDGRVPP